MRINFTELEIIRLILSGTKLTVQCIPLRAVNSVSHPVSDMSRRELEDMVNLVPRPKYHGIEVHHGAAKGPQGYMSPFEASN